MSVFVCFLVAFVGYIYLFIYLFWGIAASVMELLWMVLTLAACTSAMPEQYSRAVVSVDQRCEWERDVSSMLMIPLLPFY